MDGLPITLKVKPWLFYDKARCLQGLINKNANITSYFYYISSKFPNDSMAHDLPLKPIPKPYIFVYSDISNLSIYFFSNNLLYCIFCCGKTIVIVVFSRF